MNNEERTFGEKLRDLLHRRGLTAGDVARATGMSRQAVYQILKGKTHTPRQGTLERMAAFLGVPPNRLLVGDLPEETPGFLYPDATILTQIPETIGPELEAMIEAELPDTAPLRLEGPSSKAHQDVLKMKLYLILKKRKLASGGEEPKAEGH